MARQDPWDRFADAPSDGFVAGDPQNASIPDATQTPTQPGSAAPQVDAFAQFGDASQAAVPAHLDNSGTQYQGGFSDELPTQPASRMADEDHARVIALEQAGDFEGARQFAASKGFTIANIDAIRKAYEANGRINPDATYSLPKVEVDAAGALGRGVADTITMGALPKAGALVAGAGAALSGGSFPDGYNSQLDQNNAAIGADEQEHPWLRVAGQLLGGFALPAGLEGIGLKAGTDVLRAGGTMGDARAAAQIAVRNRMAVSGGAYGAAHGAGSADSIPDAIAGGLVEGGLGAATGGLMGQAGRSAPKADEAASTTLNDGAEVYQAAVRQGINALPADVGGPTVRRMTSAVAQTPLGAKPIIDAAQAVATSAQAARDRVAASVGQALDPEAAGNNALSGARSYIASSKQVVGGLYDAAEQAADGQRVAPKNALEALDKNITELSETPGGAPGLTTLQGLRDSLAKGQVSVDGLRRMRSVLRDQFIKDGLRGSDLERRVGLVLDAARADVTSGLRDAGRANAASLYTKADQAYRDRIATIDGVLKPLIGTRDAPKSGEQITKALTADLQSNNARATKFLRALPPEEQANTRASIIGALGRSTDGQQNAAGDAFSLPAFLTHWNKMGDTAKRAFFGDEARSALNDLALVAQGSKQAATYANRSNTGGVLASVATGATFTGGLPTLAATLATQYGLGRLLASPRFARWLARAPRTALSPDAYADRLTRIARAEPAIANEVLQLQQRLTDHFAGAPLRAAASPDESLNGQGDAGQQEPQQQGTEP